MLEILLNQMKTVRLCLFFLFFVILFVVVYYFQFSLRLLPFFFAFYDNMHMAVFRQGNYNAGR